MTRKRKTDRPYVRKGERMPSRVTPEGVDKVLYRKAVDELAGAMAESHRLRQRESNLLDNIKRLRDDLHEWTQDAEDSPMADGLTVNQKILLAARDLDAAGHAPMTIEGLTVAAWKLDKTSFGLKGFADEYPNSNVIYAAIMGERGLAKRGWLVKCGPKLYTLSRQGKEEAARIVADDGPLPLRRALAKIQLPRDLERQLVALFTTTAFRRYVEGMKAQATYRDACVFWSLDESARGEAVDAALARVPTVLAAVDQLLIGQSVELSNRQEVGRIDLDQLGRAHRFLIDQFAAGLDRQRRRGRVMQRVG